MKNPLDYESGVTGEDFSLVVIAGAAGGIVTSSLLDNKYEGKVGVQPEPPKLTPMQAAELAGGVLLPATVVFLSLWRFRSVVSERSSHTSNNTSPDDGYPPLHAVK